MVSRHKYLCTYIRPVYAAQLYAYAYFEYAYYMRTLTRPNPNPKNKNIVDKNSKSNNLTCL